MPGLDGTLTALNSYENRVYQIGVEGATPVVAKFYRPGRWPDAAIEEEHRLAFELAERDIPAVCPLRDADDRTLLQHAGFRFTVFPRIAGRWPELGSRADRMMIGRFIARLHAVGRLRPFAHRPVIDVASYGWASRETLLASGHLPPHLETVYADLSAELLTEVERHFAPFGTGHALRLHGDCHCGNILWSADGPTFVDLDDCRTGPAMQDLWMLLSGDREEMRSQLADVVDGYEEFSELDVRETALIEPLRTLRLVYYNAWLARRWDDPAFPVAFPWFATEAHWSTHVADLRIQASALEAPPIQV